MPHQGITGTGHFASTFSPVSSNVCSTLKEYYRFYLRTLFSLSPTLPGCMSRQNQQSLDNSSCATDSGHPSDAEAMSALLPSTSTEDAIAVRDSGTLSAKSKAEKETREKAATAASAVHTKRPPMSERAQIQWIMVGSVDEAPYAISVPGQQGNPFHSLGFFCGSFGFSLTSQIT